MPQRKGSNGATPRTKRELASLELIDQADDHDNLFAALDAIVVAVAHARRRLGAAQKHTVRAYEYVTGAQADEDGTTATPLADIIPFPALANRGPEPSEPMHQVAA